MFFIGLSLGVFYLFSVCRLFYFLGLDAACTGTSWNGMKLALTSFLQLEWHYIWFFKMIYFSTAIQHHDWVLGLLQEMPQKLRTQMVYSGFSKNVFDWFLYSYVHLPPTADEITGESWQLITAVVNDGLTLCEWHHKIMTALILLLLSSKSCCGDFSAISKIYFLPLQLSSSCLLSVCIG